MEVRSAEDASQHDLIKAQRFVFVLSLAVGLLLVILAGNYFLQRRVTTALRSLAESRQNNANLTLLFSELQDAETGQRGYLLTQDLSYLEPYERAVDSLANRLEVIKVSPAFAATQEQQLARLQQLIKFKTDELKQTVTLNQQGRLPEALAIVTTDVGKITMDSIRASIDRLKISVKANIQYENTEVVRLSRLVGLFQLLAGFTLIAVLYYIYTLLNPLLNKLQRAQQKIINSQRALEAKNEQVEHFAYIASHDLNEPLRSIRSFVEIIQEETAESADEDLLLHLKFIDQATERMQGLIQGLLSYSRLGKSDKASQVDLNDLIDELRADLNFLISQTGGTITSDNLPTITCVRLEIRQVLQNLLTNALKFQKPDLAPEVFITAEEKPKVWQICVADNGIGISKANQAIIFNIFSKLHLASEYGGQGIGLGFSHRIIELHQGKIWVESAPEAGSKFYFTVPKNLQHEG